MQDHMGKDKQWSVVRSVREENMTYSSHYSFEGEGKVSRYASNV